MKYSFNASLLSKITALLMAVSILFFAVGCRQIVTRKMPQRNSVPSPSSYDSWLASNNSTSQTSGADFDSPNPPVRSTSAEGTGNNVSGTASIISSDGDAASANIKQPLTDQNSPVYYLKPELEPLPSLTNNEEYYNFGKQQLAAGNVFEGYMALAHIGGYKDASSLIGGLYVKDIVLSSGLKPTVFVLMSNNELYGWGANSFGQLGNGNTSSPSRAKKISSDVAMADAGNGHVLILKNQRRSVYLRAEFRRAGRRRLIQRPLNTL